VRDAGKSWDVYWTAEWTDVVLLASELQNAMYSSKVKTLSPLPSALVMDSKQVSWFVTEDVDIVVVVVCASTAISKRQLDEMTNKKNHLVERSSRNGCCCFCFNDWRAILPKVWMLNSLAGSGVAELVLPVQQIAKIDSPSSFFFLPLSPDNTSCCRGSGGSYGDQDTTKEFASSPPHLFFAERA